MFSVWSSRHRYFLRKLVWRERDSLPEVLADRSYRVATSEQLEVVAGLDFASQDREGVGQVWPEKFLKNSQLKFVKQEARRHHRRGRGAGQTVASLR